MNPWCNEELTVTSAMRRSHIMVATEAFSFRIRTILRNWKESTIISIFQLLRKGIRTRSITFLIVRNNFFIDKSMYRKIQTIVRVQIYAQSIRIVARSNLLKRVACHTQVMRCFYTLIHRMSIVIGGYIRRWYYG